MNLQKINEVLTKTQEKDAISLTHDDHDIDKTNPSHTEISEHFKEMRDSFLEQHPVAKEMFAKGGEKRDWQIRYPVEFDVIDELQPDSTVSTFLRRNLKCKVNLDDYKKGVCRRMTMVGDESRGIPLKEKEIVISIVKLLDRENAPENIKKLFVNDPFRKSGSKSKFDLIITGHPIDIYGGSTGRGWTSCMDVGDKTFKNDSNEHHSRLRSDKIPQASYKYNPKLAANFLKKDVDNHHHMAYLVKRGGDIDHDAIARTSFKLHKSLTGGKTTLLPEGVVYGDAPQGFEKKANEIMGELFEVEEGIFSMTSEAYCDSTRIKTIGSFDATNLDFTKLRKAFNTAYDDDDAASIASEVYNAIFQLNGHDKAIVLGNLFDGSDVITQVFTGIIDNYERYVKMDRGRYTIGAIEVFINPGEKFRSTSGSTLEDSILHHFAADELNPLWHESELFHKRLTELLAHIANGYEIEHIDNAEAVITDVTSLLSEIDFSRTAFNDLHLTDMEYQNDPFIRSFLLFKHMHDNLIDKVVVSFMKKKTLTQSISEFFTEYCEYVKTTNRNHSQSLEDTTVFGPFFDWLSNAKYKTLDILFVLEQEFGQDKLEVDLDDMDSMKGWIGAYLVHILGIEFVDGKIPEFTDEQLPNVEQKIKNESNNSETRSRMYEILGIGEERFKKLNITKK